MDALAPADILAFEGFRLDRRLGSLLKQHQDGSYRPVAMGSRALDVLTVLADRQGTLLSKEEIMAAAWPNTVVEDNNLSVQISALRRILDPDRAEGSCIQTIPGRGYRFVAPVARTNSAAPPLALPPSGNGVDQRISADEQLQGRPGVPARPDEPPSQASRRPRRGMIAGVIGILFLIAAGVVGWHLRSSGSDETRPAQRLSIVVLPFADLSVARDQQYFADGVTEDLTTDLSRLEGTLVISADTALTYRNKPIDAKQIGRELGVRYVVEGSFERSDNRVRVNAQLIDAETDTHLWAERFDREISDLFALQNEITSRIAIALNLELISAEAARPAERPDALDFIFRARAAWKKPRSSGTYDEAISLLERALTRDPGSVEAQAWLAIMLVDRVLDIGSSSRDADIKRAEELATKAVAAAPGSALAHAAKAEVLRGQRRCAEAIPEYETALGINRNAVGALANCGRCKQYIGLIEEGIAAQEQAIRLSPRDPQIWDWYFRIGEGRLLQSRFDESILWLEKARGANEAMSYVPAYLAAAYALNGEIERGAAELAEARKLGGEGSWQSIHRLRTHTRYETPPIRALVEATFYEGLRKAGMAEN